MSNLFTYGDALRLPGLDLALDPPARERFAYVSHAHTDHVGRHRDGFASPPTVALVRARLGECRLQPLEFGSALERAGHALSLAPAGHVLGASQLMVDAPDGTRLVYTGDFSVRPGRIVPPATPVRCDTLVMECTFGQPRYVFPDDEEVAARVRRFIEQALDEGATPVVLGYTLGKAQEAIRLVNDLGYRVAVHRLVGQLAEVYRQFGVDCGPYDVYPDGGDGPHPLAAVPEPGPTRRGGTTRGGDLGGRVLIIPPDERRWAALRGLSLRTLYLTGWALDPSTRYRLRVDEAVPLSDHADFAELLAFVERCQPRRVYTLHGPPDFAAELRRRGFVARHLEPHQLPLFEL